MITSYEVGAVFRIGDQASPNLLKISELLTRVQTQITGIKEGFAGLGGADVARISRSLLTLDRRFAASGQSAVKASDAIIASFAKADTSIGATASAVARLNTELTRSRRIGPLASASSEDRRRAPRGDNEGRLVKLTTALDGVESRFGKIAPAATGAADTIISNFGRADAAISTTTRLVTALTSELRQAGTASAGISNIRTPRPGRGGGGQGQGGGAPPPAPPAPPSGGSGNGHGGNANWQHVGIGLGMGGFIGVHEVKATLKGVLDAGGEYQHVITGIRKQNATDDDISAAVTAARKLSQAIPGVTETEALEAYGTNRGIFGHKDAMAMMRPLLEYTQVVGGTTGDYKKATKQVYDMTRAADLMGKLVNPETHEVDTEQFKRFLELGSKVTLGTHGKVDAATWLGLAQQGGPAMGGLSDKGMITMGMVAQIMGGMRGGTALTSMYQQMVGGKMTKSAAEKLRELGVVGDFTVGRGGHVSFEKGALDTKFTKELREDPLQAVDTLKKAMEAQGLTSVEQQVPKLFEILGRQTTQRLVHDLLRNAPQMLGERDRILGSKGIDESRRLQNEQDYKQAEHNFEAAFKNFTTALGQPGVQTAVEAMNSLGKSINSIAASAGANPEVTKIVLQGIAGLGVAFGALAVAGVIAGAALLIPGGGVALAVTTLVGVFGTIAAFNWDTVASTLAAMRKATLDFLGLGDGKKRTDQNPEDVLPGIQKQSFNGPGFDQSLIHKTGLGTDGPFADAVYGGTLRAFREMMGGGAGGGAGGGSGFQNASFTTGGGANDNIGGGGVGRALGRGVGGSTGDAPAVDGNALVARGRGSSSRGQATIGTGAGSSWYEAIMRAEGTAGKDPYNVVLGNGRYGLPSKPLTDMSLAEAYAFGRTVRARHGASSALGAFQIVGRTMKTFMGEAGLTWQDKFSPENQRKLAAIIRKRQGTGAWEGFKVHPGERQRAITGGEIAPSAPPPTAGPPPKRQEQPGITHVHLDGKVIARAVTARMASSAKYPNHVGGMDTHGGWRPPGTTLTDAA